MIIRMGRSKWPVVAAMALLVGLSGLPGCGESQPPGADKMKPIENQPDATKVTKKGNMAARSIKNRGQATP